MKKFNTTINGYDKLEVNKFVDDVTVEYENMLNKLKNRDKEILILKEQLKHYQNLEASMNKTMAIAEDSSNQMKRIAKQEAQNIIEQAKKNASHIVNDALLKAEKTEMEIDRLKRSIKIYKARIKQVVEEQLTMVDDVDRINIDIREY